MKILLLHAIDNPISLRRTTLNQSFCMYKYAPEHEYVLHCYGHPIPDSVRHGSFDAILIDTTFLCYRWIRPRSQFDRLLEQYDFVARSPAVKIAFPQDDYDHSAVLDRWLAGWGVNAVFSPLAQFKELLYPLTSRTALIEQCQTGYIDPVDRDLLARAAKPRNQRTIDVGYRARNLGPEFGRAGRLKSEIGQIFTERLPSLHGLRLDISTSPEDVISGDAWLAFLGNCRFFLGGASGSSLHDPEGLIRDRVRAYLEAHPGASFEEVESECFPGEDGSFHMTALGPRNLEAALARTCQVLVPDPGLTPLQPDIHFIALDKDARNIAEVLERMRDEKVVDACVNAAQELFCREEWSYPFFVARIERHLPTRSHRNKSATINSVSAPKREQEVTIELYRSSLKCTQERYNRLYAETEQLHRRIDELGAEPRASQLETYLRDAVAERDNLKRRLADLLKARDDVDARQTMLPDRAAEQDQLQHRLAELETSLNEAIAQITLERQQADQRMRALENALRRRSGWRGAVRELLRINAFLEHPDGPTRKSPAVIVYRAWHVWRNGGIAETARAFSEWTRVRAQRREKPPVLASQAPAIPPRTITMLVPDDRIDRRVLLSARSLQEAGWRVTVIAAPYPGQSDGDQEVFPDIKIIRTDTSRYVPPPPLARDHEFVHKDFQKVYFYHNSFLRDALAHRAAVYVAHDLPVLPAALVAAREVGSRLAYDAHELYPEQHYFTPERVALFSATEATLIGKADLVTTVNESIAQEMVKRYSIAPPTVIWNAPEASPSDLPLQRSDLLRRNLGIGHDRRILLLQGGLSENRNLEDLVRSMAHVKTASAVLVIMGPGDAKREELKSIAEGSGLTAERIRFAPPVPQDQLLSFTASADVGIVPYPPIDLNSYYCTPNKLFEYIVAGLPILANDLPELRKFVAENDFGQVHRMDGPENIARAIDAMLASDLDPYRKALARRKREFVWEMQGRKLVAVYEAAFMSTPSFCQASANMSGQCAASLV